MHAEGGIGIAAPQVGRLIRLVIIDVTGPEKREGKMVLVNPVWTPLPDAGYVESEEGCLSVPDYRSKVRRTARVHVEATDLDGNPSASTRTISLPSASSMKSITWTASCSSTVSAASSGSCLKTSSRKAPVRVR